VSDNRSTRFLGRRHLLSFPSCLQRSSLLLSRRTSSHNSCYSMHCPAGAKRGLLNLPLDETVGLVGLHWGDRFFEFVPQNGKIKWQVKPWGSWKVPPPPFSPPCRLCQNKIQVLLSLLLLIYSLSLQPLKCSHQHIHPPPSPSYSCPAILVLSVQRINKPVVNPPHCWLPITTFHRLQQHLCTMTS